MKCQYCGKECVSANSHRNHERCCPSNPNRNYKNGMTGHKGRNQYQKARDLGLPLPVVSLETRKKISENSKHYHHTEEEKKHLSELAKKQGLGGHTSKLRIMYKGVQLHSSYETALAIDLDKNEIKWTRPEPMHWIDDEGDDHRYYADFYLPEYDVYLDPKNDFLIEHVNPAFGITDRQKIEQVALQNKVRIYILNKNQLSWNAVKVLAGFP